MATIKEITKAELAELVNKARKEEVGYEFSFAEYMDDDEPCGWHTCTKINETEVIMRYMGGVCFGLITDTDVEVEDIEMYLADACNYGECENVYLEIV